MAKSVPTVTGSKTLGGTIVIATNRDTNTYTHTLRYTWGSQVDDVFIAENITDSYTWTIPKSLANYILSATAGTMYLRLLTFNGSEYIGSSTINFTVTMPDTAEFNPTINDITLEEVGTPTNGLWVQKQSKVKGTLDITNAYGTSALSYKIEANGTIYNTRIFETEALINNGSVNIVATYTDKRGRQATFTKTINVQVYDNPYITSASITRINGTSAKLRLKGGISSVNDTNTKSFYYKYKLKSASTYGAAVPITNSTYTIDKEVTITGLQNAQYDFLVGIQDTYNTTEKQDMNLPTTARWFSLSPDKLKMAFFGKAVKNGLQVFAKIFDRFGTEVTNGMSIYEAGGNTDLNTTIEHLVLSNTNTPDGSLWYVETFFYSNKTATSNRTQIAYPYNKVELPCYRYYYNGSWSAWAKIGGTTNDNGIIRIGNNICIQYGMLSVRVTTGNTPIKITFNFNTPFNMTYSLIPILETSAVSHCDVALSEITASSGSIWFNRTNTSATTVRWVAIGKKVE